MIKWIRSKLWIYFSFLVLVSTAILVILLITLISILEHFHLLTIFDSYPMLRWVVPILFSSIIGVIISIVVSHYILNPITQLQQAMAKVVESDFSVQLDEKHIIIEVENLYRAFNLMINELNSIEHFQNDFTSIISHEFKTPLATIQGYVQLLQSPEISEEKRQAYYQKILHATKQLSAMTDNILKLTKLDNQSIAIDYEPYRLDEQIRHSLLYLQPQWERKQLTLTIDLEAVTYSGNEGLLEQVWNNLFDNAIKYNEDHGQIIIRLTEKNNHVYILIEDTGVGIKEDELPYIFDRFYQVDTSRFSSGNGLGLSIVKRIIDLHHGEIFFNSTYGEGTRIEIVLPHSKKTILSTKH